MLIQSAQLSIRVFSIILRMYKFCILVQMWLSFVSFTETLYHYVHKSFVAPRSTIDLVGALVLRRLTWVWNAFAPALSSQTQ